jgi:hypothetical protein
MALREMVSAQKMMARTPAGGKGKPDICPPPGFLYEIKAEKKEMFQILIPRIN